MSDNQKNFLEQWESLNGRLRLGDKVVVSENSEKYQRYKGHTRTVVAMEFAGYEVNPDVVVICQSAEYDDQTDNFGIYDLLPAPTDEMSNMVRSDEIVIAPDSPYFEQVSAVLDGAPIMHLLEQENRTLLQHNELLAKKAADGLAILDEYHGQVALMKSAIVASRSNLADGIEVLSAYLDDLDAPNESTAEYADDPATQAMGSPEFYKNQVNNWLNKQLVTAHANYGQLHGTPFYYDPQFDGFEEFSTVEERDQAAESAIQHHMGDGLWDESVENVFMGFVTHKATKTDINETEFGTSCDYKMLPVKQ